MQSARAYDVAIVGAGPAGSACAIRLLQDSSDLRIVIIDRDAMPRPKSCGDLISPVTQMRLRPLGIDVAESCLAPLTFASHAYEDFHLLMPLYVCRRWKGQVVGAEGQAIAWVRPQKLKDYPMPPADVPLIPHLVDLL